jgi:hypothetical protein
LPLPSEVVAVNVGLSLFADALRQQGRDVVEVDWRIPAGGDPAAVGALERLYGVRSSAIDQANAEVLRRLDQGVALLKGIQPARDVVAGLGPGVILHCGPPGAWSEMCDPLQRSVRAAVVAEGWAGDVGDVDRLVERCEIELEPANDHGVVVPMATAMGPSAPVLMVDNQTGGTTAFAPLNQGPGDVAWFGRDTPGAIERLVFLREVVGPLLGSALSAHGPLDVFGLVAQGLQMGDDVHMRSQATTNLLLRSLLPYLMDLDSPHRVELATFLSGNHLFFLNIAMAAAKSITLWAEQVAGSSIVTTMARNGTTFGIRLPGSAEWSLSPAPPIGQPLYYSGYGPDDAGADIGDSAVLELIGLGGSAAAASPAVAAFVGGTMADAIATTEDMDRVSGARSTRFKIPMLDYRGTPIGVDVRKVVELGITPRINTGILHGRAGTGQIGAGVAEAPVGCFRDALLALDRRLR